MERPETEITGPDRPETEIHGPERLEPNPTLLLDGIAIPTDDIELIFEDEIAGYANENPIVGNTQDQETTNAGAGYHAPPSRSIRLQVLTYLPN